MPRVAIVGAGRLGTALARALSTCGYEITALVARRLSHARRAMVLAGLTGTRPLASAQLHLLPNIELLFITTPDDRIPTVAAQLSERLGHAPTGAAATRARRVVLHTSGALSSVALAPLRERGFAVGSMHPLVSISEPVKGAEQLRGAFYCVEGERAALGAARRVVRALGGESFSVKTEAKALYHASAVMASGHVVALFSLASEMLARCGLDEQSARRVLLPLLESTFENLSRQSPSRALTGTFARADVSTVGKHLSALVAEDSADALALYRLLGRRALRLAAEQGADAARLAEIRRLLEISES